MNVSEKGNGGAGAGRRPRRGRALRRHRERLRQAHADVAEYPVKGRGTKGVLTMKLTTKKGGLAGALIVRAHQELIFISQNGMVQRTGVRGISQMGRPTQGVRVMNLKPATASAPCPLVVESGQRQRPRPRPPSCRPGRTSPRPRPPAPDGAPAPRDATGGVGKPEPKPSAAAKPKGEDQGPRRQPAELKKAVQRSPSPSAGPSARERQPARAVREAEAEQAAGSPIRPRKRGATRPRPLGRAR